MRRRLLLLVLVALLALALVTPAAIAQDDDDDDEGAAAGRALPRTGGPALLAPVAGALLTGGGLAGAVALRRNRNDV